MEFFETIRCHFGTLGIYPAQNQPSKQFNLINLSVLFVFLQFFVSSSIFLLFSANTVHEYVYSFYGSITSLSAIAIFLSVILKKDFIFELIDGCESTIQRRMYSTIGRNWMIQIIVVLSNPKSNSFQNLESKSTSI